MLHVINKCMLSYLLWVCKVVNYYLLEFVTDFGVDTAIYCAKMFLDRCICGMNDDAPARTE